MKHSKPPLSLPEAITEGALTLLFFWLFTTKVESRGDPPMIAAMLSWGISHVLLNGIKSTYAFGQRVTAAAGRFAARNSAPH